MAGEAASYYNAPPQQYGGGGYPPPEQNKDGYYNQNPPQYGQNHGGGQNYNGSQNYHGNQNYGGQQDYGNPTCPAHDYSEKPTFEEKFKVEKPKWNDVWAGVLLLCTLAGFAVVSGIALNAYSSSRGYQGGGIYDNANDFTLNTNTIILFIFCLAAAILLSYGYVWVARMFTKQFIWISGILNIVLGFVTAIYMLSRGYWSGGIVFLIFAVITLFCFISWRSRIPFSTLMLQTAIDVSKTYGHMYMVSWIGGIIAVAFGAWYSVTLVAVYVKWDPGFDPACQANSANCSHAKVIGLLVFITFAMYWISEMLKNTIHTIICGVFGSWYFSPHDLPKGATRGALKRSMTYSFGSISFGSLVLAIINALRQLCSIAQQHEGAQGNIVGYIAFCILGCLISVLNWLAHIFNKYAFAHIALYGKAYIPAAKDTWKMVKDRGVGALAQECLVGPVLSIGAMFVGYTCALLAYLYLIFTRPGYNVDGSYTPVVVAFAFVIGLQIAAIVTTPLSSGIDAIFVGMAWDPQVMQRDHPELWAKMIQVFPRVQQAVRM